MLFRMLSGILLEYRKPCDGKCGLCTKTNEIDERKEKQLHPILIYPFAKLRGSMISRI
jgi:hypothetical protein